MTPDPKPAKRIVDPNVGYEKLLRERRCRVCGEAKPLSRHHIVPKSLRGDDVDANIVPLCGDGTTGCHGKIEARALAACTILRHNLTADELAYVLGKKGPAFLDRYYPSVMQEAA